MHIRPYSLSDHIDVLEIYHLAKQDEFANEVPAFKISQFANKPLDFSTFPGIKVYVLELNNRVVGFAGHQDEHIIWMYVHPEFRGQGIASRLIKYTLSQLQGLVYLSLLKSNKKALAFYQKAGFQVDSEFSGELEGISIHAIKMTQQLSHTPSNLQVAS